MNKCCLCGMCGEATPIGEHKVICQVCLDDILASYREFIAAKPKENPCEFGM